MENQELSYYERVLVGLLKVSHPELLTDTDFIKIRSNKATEANEEAIKQGYTVIGADEIALNTLFEGLHFSKHNTIVELLWNEFSEIIPQSEAEEFAIKLLPICKDCFSHFQLNEEFAYSSKYDELCHELKEVITNWILENEL